MSKEQYYVGVYWGSRAESPRQIAGRMSATMSGLRAIHPLLAQWNQAADTYEKARCLVVEPTVEALEPLLVAIELEIPICFGYRLRLWSGCENSALWSSLKVTGGGVPESPVEFSNNCILEFAGKPDAVHDLHAPGTMLHILSCLVRVWRPDSGVVMSDEYDLHHARPDGELPTPGKPVVGWMTYLRAERLTRLPERMPCKTVDVDGLGTIFVVTDDYRFSVDNPDDVARALAVTEFLERHGALDTIPTNLPM